ncbi:MAG: GntR family transcriptional regulator [Aeromicrobium sp.]
MSDKRTRLATSGRTVALKRVSTAEAIVNELVIDILDGSLAAGTVLSEVELADRFGVSRQSLRTALAELTFRGLVHREPHRSPHVAVITRQDVSDIYYMRALLEGEAVRWLAGHSGAWPEVKRALDQLRHMPPRAPWNDIVRADVAFHQATVDAVGSARLSRLQAHLSAEMHLLLVPARHYQTQEAISAEHQRLFEVITQGDPDAAAESLRQHLDFGTGDLLAYLPDA